jgi:LAO/AO transport system kinase
LESHRHSNRGNISRIREKRKHLPSVEELLKGIGDGDQTLLARAITLVESLKKEDASLANRIVEGCISKKKESYRIGITGVPGVGKSTFIETLGINLLEQGNRVAVLAVDPSSSQNRGSILGDKTRMPLLAKHPNAFVRPSPAGNSLGGVARTTRETIILCEAAGFNIILVETVGVGQSEIAVHSMVDFFLLLKLAGAGDELQGIKRGIIEMADAIAINKADGDNVERARSAGEDFKRALQLYPPKENGWKPQVKLCSALQNKGMVTLWDMMQTYLNGVRQSGHLEQKRKLQNRDWLHQTIEEQLKRDFYGNKKIKSKLETLTQQVMDYEISPFKAAEILLQLQKKELK